jgi:hypothetical protein
MHPPTGFLTDATDRSHGRNDELGLGRVRGRGYRVHDLLLPLRSTYLRAPRFPAGQGFVDGVCRSSCAINESVFCDLVISRHSPVPYLVRPPRPFSLAGIVPEVCEAPDMVPPWETPKKL